ncbi:MAG: efflux RND transporter permease subunit [Gammaproteobacteria bacterium]|nr:efflux RND transporter permease subunit [Gammaproteobacteria bacterium]NNF49351.1 efflux RND transporter permease subunit [Woeseiaceae bacterium]NNL62611.1 efflux RND transporter permease subunit [Woeseiaceae bacterium]
MRRLIEIATQRRVTIAMFMVAIVLFGMVSLARLKLNLLPDISYPTLTVRTELTGAAPAEIENLLTKPIEETVGVVRNARVVRSVSRSGQSDVTIEFLWGTDMDLAGVDVREKLDILQLPLEAERPMLLRFDPSSEPIVRLGMLRSEETAETVDAEASLKELRRIAEENIKTELEAEEGTAAVKVSGGLEDEIQIDVDQQKLSQLGLSINEIAARIRAENVNLSGGRLEEGSQRFLVRTLNEFQSVEEFRDAIVAYVADRPVYLRDVATVVRGFKEREAITRVRGRESVELAVYKEGDANTVQVANRVARRVATMTEELAEDGIELVKIYDQSTFISSAVNDVRVAALLGGLIAIVVLYGFLRDARSTTIVGIAIPVSVIGAFLLMYANDLSLNIMSLGGIALAVGMLVDNSIVVLENIVRKKEQGQGILDAAQNGTTEVGSAVVAATLTTIAVFFPMIFIQGIAGELFRDQALTVTFALIFSLVVALTLIPMLAALGAQGRYAGSPSTTEPLPAREPTTRIGRIFAAIGRFLRRVVAFIVFVVTWVAAIFVIVFGFLKKVLGWILWVLLWVPTWLLQRLYRAIAAVYPGLLDWSLRHQGAVVATAVLIFVATMSLLPRLGTELIPQFSQGEFNVDLRLAPGAPLSETDRAIQAAQRAATDIDAIELDYSVAGTGNRLDANPVDAGDHAGTLSVRMAPGSGRLAENAAINAMRDELARLPGVQFEFSRPALFTFASPLQIEIAGYDLDALDRISGSVVQAMTDADRFTDIRTTVERGNPEIQIVFDQERAAKLGLAVRDIADRVVANVRGELATRYTLRDRKIDVLVRSIDPRASSIDEIRRLIVNPDSARPVTLDAVANVGVSHGPAEIRRIAQERVAIITANLAYGDLGAATAEAGAILARIPMPDDVTAIVAGQSEEMEASFNSMVFALALAVFLVYLVMASQFESLIHPLVILFTIPLALVGAVLALFVTGTTVNIVALIGVIMLAGIVVNNAIVLVDLINQLRAKGSERLDAIMEAGTARLRPILMTSLTTALGLLPMAMGFGEGAEVRTPMAITVIGGLTVSTLLTLIVIPVVYSLMDRKQMRAAQ